MKNQTYRMTMLYDFYGELLTERQQEFYDLYYNEDLSLAEIAENYGITRQGVRDIIVRAEATLQEVEDKTGLIRRYYKMESSAEELREILDGMLQINLDRFQDDGLQALCLRLESAIATLRKD